MEIKTNIPFKEITTMRLGGNARFVAEIEKAEDAATVCKNAKSQNLPIFVIGDGSNLIAKDTGFNGIMIHVKIPGFEVISEDESSATIKIGAGENWDSTVEKCVNMNLSGVEAMSGIPGTVGATPIQNVGAYGQEIADTLQSVKAYDINEDKYVALQAADCKLTYRSSIFREDAINRYVITSVTIKLSKDQPKPPFYSSLQKYLDANNIKDYTNKIIRESVIKIRKEKLPDYRVQASSGSFFKNVIIDQAKLDELKSTYPDIPAFDSENNKFKIPTGWLIDKAGLKGKLIHGMRVYDTNAVVLVNESASSYSDLAAAREEITKIIKEKFNLEIEQEPLEIT
ncbi:MAG: UDP-N-acetylmuramate dehydrogenase [Candidatus Saccharibacteria bacterium]